MLQKKSIFAIESYRTSCLSLNLQNEMLQLVSISITESIIGVVLSARQPKNSKSILKCKFGPLILSQDFIEATYIQIPRCTRLAS